MEAEQKTSSSIVGIAQELRNTVESVVCATKDAVTKVAPAVWKSIKLKVIGDAVALLIVVIAITVGAIYINIIPAMNKYLFVVSVSILGIIIASAVKRIIGSDFYTLIELLDIAKRDKK